MTVRNPPFVVQALSHDAETFRRALKSSWASAGVLTNTGLAVTAQGTPNMTVNVAAGEAIIFGTQQAEQGAYHVYNDASVTMPAHDASDPTNPRNDLIVYKVEDAEYSGATNASSIAIVKGTAAATPVDPAVPANAISLARVRVGAAATTVTNANITSLRVMATQKPWNLPWGVVFEAQKTSNQTPVTSLTDLTGLTTGSITPVANRKYKVTVYGFGSSTVAGDIIGFVINNGASIQSSATLLAGAGTGLSSMAVARFVTSGSAVTIKAQMGRTSGTGVITNVASATTPTNFIVEDMGPATTL